jgi:hypothetical protein
MSPVGLYELLTQLNCYVLLMNMFLLVCFFAGKGFKERLAGIGRSPTGLLIICCFIFGSLTFILEDRLTHLANSYSLAIWPVRIIWYFGFAFLNIAAFWVAFLAMGEEFKNISRLFKSAALTLTAKAFVFIFGFIDRFAFDDLLHSYYELANPTLNISLIIIMGIMVYKFKNSIEHDLIDSSEKMILLESGATIYLQTIQESDLMKSQKNHEFIKYKFQLATNKIKYQKIEYSNVYVINKCKTLDIETKF